MRQQRFLIRPGYKRARFFGCLVLCTMGLPDPPVASLSSALRKGHFRGRRAAGVLVGPFCVCVGVYHRTQPWPPPGASRGALPGASCGGAGVAPCARPARTPGPAFRGGRVGACLVFGGAVGNSRRRVGIAFRLRDHLRPGGKLPCCRVPFAGCAGFVCVCIACLRQRNRVIAAVPDAPPRGEEVWPGRLLLCFLSFAAGTCRSDGAVLARCGRPRCSASRRRGLGWSSASVV